MLKTLAEREEGPDRESLYQKATKAPRLHMTIQEEFVYPLIKMHVGPRTSRPCRARAGP